MNLKLTAYWATTAVLVCCLVSGAAGEVAHQWGTLETVTILGYPAYVLTIIGVWKVLGSLALLAPGLPRLKEWAYAGIVFNMTGAAASHVLAEDSGPYAYHVIATLAVGLLAVASWALRPPGRRLGELAAAPTMAAEHRRLASRVEASEPEPVRQ